MYPHERSLVKQFAGRPFALLGVNSDEDRAALKKVIAQEPITWRSWFDGGKLPGPIATTWGISGWPSFFVIDHKGIMQYWSLPLDSLDRVLERLVTEAENDGR